MAADPREDLAEIARLLQNQLRWQRELGTTELLRFREPPRPVARAVTPEASPVAALPSAPAVSPPAVSVPSAPSVAVPSAPAVSPPAAVSPAAVSPAAVSPAESSVATVAGAGPGSRESLLRVIQDEVAGCVACKLASRRTQTVFARGSAQARVIFVGEGPGEHEDRRGLPFVGPAGQLLDKIIAAMNLRAEDVYICNVVKCRPPGNRTPEADEVAACSPFLARQIEIIRPEVMVALGRTAAGLLLGTNAPMGSLRGTWHDYRGVPLLPTWHPSYLLREPTRKRETWADMQLVMARLGIAPAGRE